MLLLNSWSIVVAILIQLDSATSPQSWLSPMWLCCVHVGDVESVASDLHWFQSRSPLFNLGPRSTRELLVIQIPNYCFALPVTFTQFFSRLCPRPEHLKCTCNAYSLVWCGVCWFVVLLCSSRVVNPNSHWCCCCSSSHLFSVSLLRYISYLSMCSLNWPESLSWSSELLYICLSICQSNVTAAAICCFDLVSWEGKC